MDPILQMFFSWQFIIFCLGIAAIVFVIRSVAEYLIINYLKSLKNLMLWKELILPILPVTSGGVTAWFLKSYPYPPDLSFNGGRIIFGIVAGFLSGLVYRVIKGILNNKANNPDISVNANIQMNNLQPMQSNTIQQSTTTIQQSNQTIVPTNISINYNPNDNINN